MARRSSLKKRNTLRRKVSEREQQDGDKDYLASHLSVFGPQWKERGYFHPQRQAPAGADRQPN